MLVSPPVLFSSQVVPIPTSLGFKVPEQRWRGLLWWWRQRWRRSLQPRWLPSPVQQHQDLKGGVHLRSRCRAQLRSAECQLCQLPELHHRPLAHVPRQLWLRQSGTQDPDFPHFCSGNSRIIKKMLKVNANMTQGISNSGVCSRIYAKLTSLWFVNASLELSSFLNLLR